MKIIDFLDLDILEDSKSCSNCEYNKYNELIALRYCETNSNADQFVIFSANNGASEDTYHICRYWKAESKQDEYTN